MDSSLIEIPNFEGFSYSWIDSEMEHVVQYELEYYEQEYELNEEEKEEVETSFFSQNMEELKQYALGHSITIDLIQETNTQQERIDLITRQAKTGAYFDYTDVIKLQFSGYRQQDSGCSEQQSEPWCGDKRSAQQQQQQQW